MYELSYLVYLNLHMFYDKHPIISLEITTGPLTNGDFFSTVTLCSPDHDRLFYNNIRFVDFFRN